MDKRWYLLNSILVEINMNENESKIIKESKMGVKIFSHWESGISRLVFNFIVVYRTLHFTYRYLAMNFVFFVCVVCGLVNHRSRSTQAQMIE